MRKIVVTEFISLDGVFEDPGGAEGFKYGGWSMKFNTDSNMQFKYDELFAADALLLGRITYEGFAKAWPNAQGTGDFGERMNSISKYVISTTLEQADWNNSHIIQDNVLEEIIKLKNQAGMDILVAGSGQLVNTLIENKLVDEFNLMVYPVILNEGKRLFKDGKKMELELIEAKAFEEVVLLRYRTTG